jgi:glycosyltransferase involved in cell wall biosynthesis
MRLSIILPCRNEARYIGACLDSILASEHPRADLEVLVVDGRSDDGTREIVAGYAARHPAIRLLDNPKGIVPTALNLGIRAAAGDVIMRMDAHVVYPPDYIPRLLTALEESGADNVGGCIATLPAGPGPVARAIAIALSHRFGVGNSHFRVGASAPRLVDTVPFGCYRREVFDRIGLFDEELVRNQDDEFNHRLIRHGGRVLLVPGVVASYYPRGSFPQLARMYYQYGCFKPLVARKLGRVMTIRQLVPPAFVLGVLLLGLLAPAWPPARLLWLGVMGSYALAVALAVLSSPAARSPRTALALAAAFPVVHASYGAGFLRGVWGLAMGPRRPWADPGVVPLSRGSE